MDPPQLPTELIVVIESFSPARSARAIHEETLPVLYETIVWEGGKRWWIQQSGDVPRGWKHTRYLVAMKHQLENILHYFKLITEKKKYVGIDDRSQLERVFPRIVVTVTKEIALHRNRVPVFDLSCTIYEPITVSTFLSVCTTRRYRCKTTFIGATVQAAQHSRRMSTLDNNRYQLEDRIKRITLRDDGEITGTAARAEWFGTADSGNRDLIISLNGDEDDGDRGPCVVNETLETILRLIPPPRETAIQPYYVEVRGFDIDSMHLIPKFLDQTTCRIRLTFPVFPNSSWTAEPEDLNKFKERMTLIATKYAEEWHRLGTTEPHQTIFSSYYDDLENPVKNDRHATIDYKIVGTLKTRNSNRPHEEPDVLQEPVGEEVRDGFDLVVRRLFIDDWAADDNYDHIRPGRSGVVSQKWYCPATR